MASERPEDEVPEEAGEAGVGEETVASPCIGVCKLNPLTKLCEGCYRTGAEIGLWRDADDQWRRAVLERTARRRAGISEAPASP